MNDEFDFDYVEFGMRYPFGALWHTDSTGLNIVKCFSVV